MTTADDVHEKTAADWAAVFSFTVPKINGERSGQR